MGAACMLSSGQGCTCLLTNWINNSVSPPVQTRWPTCPCAQSHVAMSAQTQHHTSLHETWQPWECQSIFHVPLPGGWAEPKQEAGTAPDTLPWELERDCSRADGYAQIDSSSVPQSCAPLPAHHGHLLHWLQFGACPPCYSAVAWLQTSSWQYHGHGVAPSWPACSSLL